MSENMTCELFSEHVGSRFQLPLDSGDSMELELVEAELSKVQQTQADRAPFALVFRGPADIVLPQQLYALSHEALGAVTIFLVPIGPDDEGMRYEAIFH